MDRKKAEPIESRDGEQMDDNIDDLGRKPDGTKLEQTFKKDRHDNKVDGVTHDRGKREGRV